MNEGVNSDMTDPAPAVVTGYHAHVYFDVNTRDKAWALRESVGKVFAIPVGRFHEKVVGPHPRWSYQLTIPADQFGVIVPWLMLHRDGLTVFVHPETGDDLADHTKHAIWMGEMPELNLDALR
jgi:DOPA 4,5-dioxygenase